MSQTTYGSITIVDITDVGQLSVYPTSNQPLSIIYDPNNGNNGSYTPDWSVNATNLQLTPVIYYNNTTLNASQTTVTWKRREGVGSITNLTTGENVNNTTGVLTVSQNKFVPVAPSTNQPPMITYIVNVAYQEPDTGTTLNAEGQITFSLVKLASTAKTCSISGGTVFKYNTNQTLVGDTSITLTATVTGVSISAWQYKTSGGTWATYPNSDTSNTLVVQNDANVFVNDVCNIKLVTTDNAVYDIHTITKLRDGAAGSGTITAVLTNEDQMIAFPNTGSPDFSQATSQILIYNGGTLDTSNWTITQSATNNLTTTSSATVKANDTVAVTGMTGDTGSVTFTCTRTGYANIIKMFSVVKVQQGADAPLPIIYSLNCPSVAVNKSSGDSPVYTPSSITVTPQKQEGNTITSYPARIKITSGATVIHSINEDESSYTITSSNLASAATNGYMIIELYAAGGGDMVNVLDKQTIVITSDGEQGEQGEQGEAGVDAINVILGNQADVIPCTSANKPQSQFTIDIPYVGYKGITQVACSVVNPPNILGVSPSNTSSTATSTAIGHLIYVIPTTTNVNTAEGNVSLTFSCEGKTVVHTYRWTRSTAATNGVNAKLFEAYTIGGNYFTVRESQTITMLTRLMDGSADVTSSATDWKWYVFDSTIQPNGDYRQITGDGTSPAVAGASSLAVNNSEVNGYASYKVTCRYDNTLFTAYYVLLDKLDPIQATVFSSVGNQLLNNLGVGALYVIVTDTGTGLELDPLKSDRFLTEAPTSPTVGDFYYHLDTTNKVATLKKYGTNGWADATSPDIPTGTYSWTFRNKDGEPYRPSDGNGHNITNNQKVIYIDGTLVNKKLIADVSVDI